MEQFTSVIVEAYISAAWVNLTPDVMETPHLKWNTGIMSNGPTDRVGDPEILKFHLKNGANNSAGVEGYYSPEHPNKLTGWTTGLRVRLSFTYEGRTYYKYHGRIAPDGLTVEPGVLGKRNVAVVCEGFMALAARHDFTLPTYTENKRADEVVALILPNMPVQPLATQYAAGVDSFPAVFDTVNEGQRAIAEFRKVAMSELGYVYTKGDITGGETLVVENRNSRTGLTENTKLPIGSAEAGFLLKEDGGYILKEDGGRIILDETQDAIFDNTMMPGTVISFGKHLTNRVKANVYPSKVDSAATTVLATLQNEIELAPGETKSGIRIAYRDPAGGASRVNGKDMVTPAATTDYLANTARDGSGTNKTAFLTVTATYGTEAVSYNLQNTDSVTIWVTFLQARGRGIYHYDPTITVKDDTASQAIHGILAMTIDMQYQQDPALGEAFADFILDRETVPHSTVDRVAILANRNSLSMYSFLLLEPGTRAYFKEDMNGIDADYFINGYDAEILPGKDGPIVKWMPVLKANSELGG